MSTTTAADSNGLYDVNLYNVTTGSTPPTGGGDKADHKKKNFPLLRKLGTGEVRAEFAKIKSEMKHQHKLLKNRLHAASSSPSSTFTDSVFDEDIATTTEDDEDVPPDEFLCQKMQIILVKKLVNVSIDNYYDICWSEGQNPYGSWLISQGKEEVNVGEWEEGEFVEDISGEQFTKRRVVTFQFMKFTSVAFVTNTQYCRVEGNDKCVIAMNIRTDGITFCDTFIVIVRWVATRIGMKNLKIQVGVHVDFLKSTMFESKIRSGVIENTSEQQGNLFEKFKNACSSKLGGIEEVEDVPETKILPSVVKGQKWRPDYAAFTTTFLLWVVVPIVLSFVILHFFPSRWHKNNDDVLLRTQVNDIKSTLEILLRELQNLQKDTDIALQTVNSIVATKQTIDE